MELLRLALLALTLALSLDGQIIQLSSLEGLLTPSGNLRGDPDEFVSPRQISSIPQHPVTQTRRHARNETAVRNLREADRLESEESRSHPKRHRRPYSRNYKKPQKKGPRSKSSSGTDDFDNSDSYEGNAGYSSKASYNRQSKDSYQDSDHKTIKKNDKKRGKGRHGDHIGSRRVRDFLYGGFGFDF